METIQETTNLRSHKKWVDYAPEIDEIQFGTGVWDLIKGKDSSAMEQNPFGKEDFNAIASSTVSTYNSTSKPELEVASHVGSSTLVPILKENDIKHNTAEDEKAKDEKAKDEKASEATKKVDLSSVKIANYYVIKVPRPSRDSDLKKTKYEHELKKDESALLMVGLKMKRHLKETVRERLQAACAQKSIDIPKILKEYEDVTKEVNQLQKDWDVAHKVEQEVYQKMQNLKQLFDMRLKFYYQNLNDIVNIRTQAAKKLKYQVEKYSNEQVENMMTLWKKNENFRKQYVKDNMLSTLRRLGSSDARSIGIDEDITCSFEEQVESYVSSHDNKLVEGNSSTVRVDCILTSMDVVNSNTSVAMQVLLDPIPKEKASKAKKKSKSKRKSQLIPTMIGEIEESSFLPEIENNNVSAAYNGPNLQQRLDASTTIVEDMRERSELEEDVSTYDNDSEELTMLGDNISTTDEDLEALSGLRNEDHDMRERSELEEDASTYDDDSKELTMLGENVSTTDDNLEALSRLRNEDHVIPTSSYISTTSRGSNSSQRKNIPKKNSEKRKNNKRSIAHFVKEEENKGQHNRMHIFLVLVVLVALCLCGYLFAVK